MPFPEPHQSKQRASSQSLGWPIPLPVHSPGGGLKALQELKPQALMAGEVNQGQAAALGTAGRTVSHWIQFQSATKSPSEANQCSERVFG